MNGPRSEWEDAAPTNISPRIVENIDRVLKSVRSYLGMDVAFLSEFLGTSRVFRSVDSARPDTPIKVGGVIPMAQGYCQHIVDGRLPELIPDTADGAARPRPPRNPLDPDRGPYQRPGEARRRLRLRHLLLLCPQAPSTSSASATSISCAPSRG